MVVKDCPAVVTAEACPRLVVMNYPQKKNGCMTFTFAMLFSISMHAYSCLWALFRWKYGYVSKAKIYLHICPLKANHKTLWYSRKSINMMPHAPSLESQMCHFLSGSGILFHQGYFKHV